MIDNIHLLELDTEDLELLFMRAKLPTIKDKIQYTVVSVDPITVHISAIQAPTAMATPAKTIHDVAMDLFTPFVKDRILYITALPYNKASSALTEPEQKLVALALFGYVMRAGPDQFARVIDIANKIGATDQLQEYANSWINTPKTPESTVTLNTEATAKVKFVIFHGILAQWHNKHDPHFAKILCESVYKELFESRHYKSAILELLNRNNENT
jgi:hypothetical protein